MKVIVWEGTSKTVLRRFPEKIRKDLGTGLMYLQLGALPRDAKPFKTGASGTWELRVTDGTRQYRIAYACVTRDVIHVLHCFIKKSAKTASLDVQLIQLRYRRVLQRMRDDEK